MTETTHDRTVRWLSEYLQKNPHDDLKFGSVRRTMKKEGESFLSCYLLDNKFLYGRLLREAREL